MTGWMNELKEVAERKWNLRRREGLCSPRRSGPASMKGLPIQCTHTQKYIYKFLCKSAHAGEVHSNVASI